MKKTRLKAALHYQLDYVGWSVLIVGGIAIAIVLLLHVLVAFTTVDDLGILVVNNVPITTINIGAVLALTIFIIGVGGAREDIKFFIQHGISRVTIYLSTLYGSLISALAVGLLFEILNVVATTWYAFPIAGMFFSGYNFIVGWLLQAFCVFAAWQFGTFISLLLYRMSKIQKIIFITAIACLVIFGIPRFFMNMVNDVAFEAFIMELEGSANILTPMVFGVFGTLCAALNFLLIRRAPIKE